MYESNVYVAFRGSVASLWVKAHGFPKTVKDLEKFEEYVRMDENGCIDLEQSHRKLDASFENLKATIAEWKPI